MYTPILSGNILCAYDKILWTGYDPGSTGGGAVSCDQTFTAESGLLQSPVQAGSNQYPNNARCVLSVTVPAGKVSIGLLHHRTGGKGKYWPTHKCLQPKYGHISGLQNHRNDIGLEGDDFSFNILYMPG